MSGSRIWNPGSERDAFDARHPGWLARIPGGPLYCLPAAAIARLEQPGHGRPPLLDRPAAEAERDLLAHCWRYGAVGFDGRKQIQYPYLSPPLPLPARDDANDLGWTESQWKDAERLVQRTQEATRRLQGYAGWLCTEPAFLAAVQDLAARWRALPDPDRPDFPLRHPAVMPRSAEATALDTIQTFAGDFEAFCNRWSLTGMATWDLPLPQGPLTPSLLPARSPALPAHAVHLILPLHYPLKGADALLEQILDQQRQLAAELDLDLSVAGLPHHKIYARILEVVHLERTITDRYARPGHRPRGFVRVLVEAIAEAMFLSIDQANRLRKAISACRRGRRADLTRLRFKDS